MWSLSGFSDLILRGNALSTHWIGGWAAESVSVSWHMLALPLGIRTYAFYIIGLTSIGQGLNGMCVMIL
jgi:hypothetical protein